MMHPQSQLRHIDEVIGHGVFATGHIPAGTITYVRDKLDIAVQPDDPMLQFPEYRKIIETWAYREPDGENILGWDISRYVNHSCQPNTLTTGYGFEIAIRDIHPDEEITDDYGLLNIEHSMACYCNSTDCRWEVRQDDNVWLWQRWDRILKPLIENILTIEQPLSRYVDKDTWTDLLLYINTGNNYHYRSVKNRLFRQEPVQVAI